MAIQIILIAVSLVLFAFFVRSAHSVRTQAVKRIGFVVFVILNLDAVLRPNDTTWLAHKVGVGRGADLLLYLLVVAFAFYSVNTFLRFRNLERRFTDLARSIALSNAQTPQGPAGADGGVTVAAPRRSPEAAAGREAGVDTNPDTAPAAEASAVSGGLPR